MIGDALERYYVWQEHKERITDAYNWLQDEIEYQVKGRRGQPSDKDYANFVKLLGMLDQANEFASEHLKELGDELRQEEAI